MSMNILEAADYMYGRKYMKELSKEPYRADEDIIKLGKELLKKHVSADRNLKVLDSDKIFYRMEPDMKNDIPAAMREELFYALKLEYASPIVPAKILFLLDRCKNMYRSMNLVPRVLPATDLRNLFSKNYLAEGYSPRDVICSLFQSNYKPLREGDLAVPSVGEDMWDIYIEATDTVAIVPTKIRNELNNDDIKRLDVKGKDIVLADTPIKFLGGYIGAVNSTYDLSALI